MPVNRRDLLRGVATATTVGAAGCSLGTPGTAPTNTDGPGTDTTADFDPVPGADLSLEPVADGFVSPTQLTAAPGTGARYVVDQVGTIHELGPDGDTGNEPWLDFRNRVQVNSEKGLLGLAFHPEFPDDPRIFLRYSVPRREGTPSNYSHTELLTEMEVADGDPQRDTERTLIEFPSPTIYHQAGTLAFGPDGYLYVAMGEGTKRELAQDVESNLLGAIHRIDVDSTTGDKPYGIPEDNPLVGEDGRDEYYAWGFRNPWRMSFNDGDLVVGDVGSYQWEELDVVERGQNYGWPYREGAHCTGWNDTDTSGEHCGVDMDTVPGDDFADPVLEFPHSGGGNLVGTAVIAGFTYGREDIPALQGQYLFGNYTTTLEKPRGSLFGADPTAEGEWPAEKLVVGNGPSGEVHRVVNSFGRDRDGHVYVLGVAVADTENRFAHTAGEVLKVVPPGEATRKLSET